MPALPKHHPPRGKGCKPTCPNPKAGCHNNRQQRFGKSKGETTTNSVCTWFNTRIAHKGSVKKWGVDPPQVQAKHLLILPSPFQWQPHHHETEGLISRASRLVQRCLHRCPPADPPLSRARCLLRGCPHSPMPSPPSPPQSLSPPRRCRSPTARA